jgi:pimeloyl-ACP methyl ester carboxylesterase
LPAFLLVSCAGIQRAPEGSVRKIAASPSAGFGYDCYLYRPAHISCPRLLVIPNNSGFADDDIAKHDESARRAIASFGRLIADRLGCALLMPVFPRTRSHGEVYTHALDRDTLMEGGRSRLDMQLLAMIEYVRGELRQEGERIDAKVFLFGFSASGMFVNRFALIHPDVVKVVVCGSPGGWPIAPIASYQGVDLTYPVGVSDLEAIAGTKIDLAGFGALPQYLFIGSEDRNDSVPFEDGYEPAQRDIVFSLFGEDLVKRFGKAESIYGAACPGARFKVYPGTGHIITDAMIGDVIAFFREQCR